MTSEQDEVAASNSRPATATQTQSDVSLSPQSSTANSQPGSRKSLQHGKGVIPSTEDHQTGKDDISSEVKPVDTSIQATSTGYDAVPRSTSNATASGDRHGRNRGYSLRRSIFSQHIQKQSAPVDTVIEMEQPTLLSSQRPKSGDSSQKDRDATITIAESSHDGKEASTGVLHHKWLRLLDAPSSIFTRVRARAVHFGDRMLKAKPLPPSLDGRHVTVNTLRNEHAIDGRSSKPHIDNTIISCRYTPWDFFPRQLVAQFGKLANFYFLCISILQMIPGLSTTGTYTTIIPLLIFVGISMAKEGYDDLRRHRLDKEENEREVHVLDQRTPDSAIVWSNDAEARYRETATTGWRSEKWQDVRVGNVVLLTRDQPIPADVLLLHVNEPTGSAFIETKSLDGETNLKTKKPLAEISARCQDLDSVAALSTEVVVQDPNLDLYHFDGRASVAGRKLPLTNSEVVYRGSVLRNTPSALGLVIYSGEECKIRMNANKSPRVKAPALQGAVNKIVVFVAALVFSMAFLMTGLYEDWRHSTETESWYLTSARVPFGFILTSFIIMFNTMLPLSLYVSLEIVKVFQMMFLNDIDIYDAESDIPMEAHTSTINEELGQVSYIFSDKTGTLTNNSMMFRKMSVAGAAWLHDMDIQDDAVGGHPKLLHKKRGGKGKENPSGSKQRQELHRQSTTSALRAPTMEWKPSTRAAESLHCGKTEQLLEYLRRKPHSVYARKAKFFILALALCHTATPEKDDEGNIGFQAASPDELALVTAAKELGYLVTDCQSKSITLKTYPNGEHEEPVYDVYEVMDVIEFSSARKRMSIVIKLPDQRLCLFVKGADTTISKLLRLAELADTTTSTVRRNTRQRQSLEAQEFLRRTSTQDQGDPRVSRSSIHARELSLSLGRASSTSMGGRRSARDSVDQWLGEREHEVNFSVPRRTNSYYTPRQSTQHSAPRPSGYQDAKESFARSGSFHSSVKGADVDNLVNEAVAVDDSATFEHCFQHIDDFATEGLRTLLYAYRFIPEDEYKRWRDLYFEASTSLENRQEKMEAVGQLIETNLELLGATAIEDKLQQGVPDAIDRFRRAGIKMWMLTGDKRETAINIGHSCRLIKSYSTVLVLDHELEDLRTHLKNAARIVNSAQAAHSVLVIDGQTLSAIEANPAFTDMFTAIAISSASVICCRASPSQKASLVKTIRKRVKGSVTLAIGDGANDIAMIQEAHVGIGIAGKEGLQAARTSDYSIAQFRFLLKLLLVHGRWNYIRICKYTLGTFWKEMFFYLVQAMYQRWNGYSGTSLYEPWSLTMFNTLFTSLPVIFMGIFEKDLAASTLLAVPELYSIGRDHKGFNFKLYVWWASMGAVEAVMVYFIMYGIFGQALFTRDNCLYAMGCLAYTICITSIAIKLQVIELHNKSTTAVSAIVLSVGGWWVWNLVLSSIYNKSDPIYNVNHGITERFGRNPLWWLTLILGVMAVVLFEISIKTIRTAIWPSDVDTFQILEHDLEVRKRFEEASSDLLQQGWSRGIKKSSLDLDREAQHQAEREAQVQELLERPRTFDGKKEDSEIRRRQSGQDDGTESVPVAPSKTAMQEKDRRSIDISELFTKGFGKVKKGQTLD